MSSSSSRWQVNNYIYRYTSKITCYVTINNSIINLKFSVVSKTPYLIYICPLQICVLLAILSCEAVSSNKNLAQKLYYKLQVHSHFIDQHSNYRQKEEGRGALLLRVFNMRRSWLWCFVLLISMVALRATNATNLSRDIFDPCKRSGGPHPGCPPNNKAAKGPPKEANRYKRGCNHISLCRNGHNL